MKNKIVQDYLAKTEAIKIEFEKYDSESKQLSDMLSTKSINKIPTKELEFKHLVYRYNQDLPLNNHLKEVAFRHGYSISYNSILNYLELINFFIKYLTEEIELIKKEEKLDDRW